MVLAAGTRVRLLTAIGGHPAGSEGVVVYDFGNDVCQIALDTGEQLTIACSAIQPVEEPTPSA